MPQLIIILSLSYLIVLAGLQVSYAVKFKVINNATTTPGGVRFNSEIGLEYSKQTLKCATDFIWSLFQQETECDRKKVPKVSLFIEDIKGIAYEEDSAIYLNANYVQDYTGDLKKEITGILYHETTHVWQWFGNNSTPQGLIEGIADFVRLRAGYAPSHWVKPGQGDRWDQGYDITALFLDYCSRLRKGFVAELNKKMRNAYSADYFVVLLGKTVDQLWTDYKAKYNTSMLVGNTQY